MDTAFLAWMFPTVEPNLKADSVLPLLRTGAPAWKGSPPCPLSSLPLPSCPAWTFLSIEMTAVVNPLVFAQVQTTAESQSTLQRSCLYWTCAVFFLERLFGGSSREVELLVYPWQKAILCLGKVVLFDQAWSFHRWKQRGMEVTGLASLITLTSESLFLTHSLNSLV